MRLAASFRHIAWGTGALPGDGRVLRECPNLLDRDNT